MSNVFIHRRSENTCMKVPPVRIQTSDSKIVPQVKKPTPVKDALVVSGYCSTPIIFYETACWISKKVNKKWNNNLTADN